MTEKTGQVILDQDGKETLVIKPQNPNTQEEQAIVEDITARVNEMALLQTQGWREFNERTLFQYTDDNEKRINNYVAPRDEDLDDWQTKGFEGITREKMFAFVSAVAMKRPEYKFEATKKDGEMDRVVADVVSGFHEYSWQKEDPTGVGFFLTAWDTAGHGTNISYEGIVMDETVKEDFDEYDVKTGTIEGLRTTKVFTDLDCAKRMLRLTDFLIPDWYQPDIQKQPYIAETLVLSRSRFNSIYGGYYNADKVPELQYVKEYFGQTFYQNQWENITEVGKERVHLTLFYEKGDKRRFTIIANGVLIARTPFPRKDGKYPYAKTIFKPLADASFFYAKALPDEIAYDQDIYNAFKNMVVDRSILYINRPLITDAQNEFADVFLSPSKILNLKGNVTQLDIAPPGQADFQMLQELRSSINRQSSDPQQSGQAGTGVTAREIVIADEHARRLAGVFRLFLEAGDFESTKLRVGNIMQFYFEPQKVSEILDDKTENAFEIVYRSFALSGKKLSDGKIGIKSFSLTGNEDEIETLKESNAVDEMIAKEQGIELEKLSISASYIKNFTVDVMVLPESTYETSRSLNLALENEYQKTVATLYPQKWQEYNSVFFKQLNEIYDKDETDFDEGVKEEPQTLPAQIPNAKAIPVTEGIGTGTPTLGRLSGMTA